jgi:hypothetical protein
VLQWEIMGSDVPFPINILATAATDGNLAGERLWSNCRRRADLEQGTAMSKLTPILEKFYGRWLTKIPSTCRPHFYNLSHRHKTVFLMETPLSFANYYWLKTPPPRTEIPPYIAACRETLICWFKGDKRKRDVWTRIAGALPKTVVRAKLATVDQLIDEVYFTDCAKCESDKNDSVMKHWIEKEKSKNGRSKAPTGAMYHCDHNPTLCDELKLLERPILFIAVGDKAWKEAQKLQNNFFKGKLSPVCWPYRDLRGNPLQNTDALEEWFRTHKGVTDVHGVLFKDEDNKFVIPFTFTRSGELRDSGIKYLEEGLTALDRCLRSSARTQAGQGPTEGEEGAAG